MHISYWQEVKHTSQNTTITPSDNSLLLHKLQRVITITLLLAAVLFFFSHRANAAKAEHVSLHLKWNHQFQFAGYYMAKEKGFYDDAGFDVTIIEGGPDKDAVEAVADGSVEFGVSGSEILLRRSDENPLVVLAPIMQHSIRAIFARTDHNINSLHDLASKKLVLNLNESEEFEAMFLNEGILLDSIIVNQKTGNAINQFCSGEIDAINGSIANQPFIFNEKKIPYTTIRPINYGIDFYGDCLITHQHIIDRDPDMVDRFTKASLKGWEYAFNHPEETIDIIKNNYASHKSIAHLEYEYEILKSCVLPNLVELGQNNPHRWEHIANTYKRLNMLPDNYSIKGLYYNREYAKSQMIQRIIVIGSTLLILLFGVFIVIVIFNRQLQRTVTAQTETLTLSNLFTQNIFDAMPSKLFSVNSSGKITHVNKTAALSCPVLKEGVINNFINYAYPPIIDHFSAFQTCLNAEDVIEIGEYEREVNGKKIYEKIVFYPIKNNGDTNVVIRIDDVTFIHEINERLQDRYKMDAIGRLAGGIAHDFNNMLCGIIGCVDIIKNQINQQNSPILKYVDIIGKTADRSADLTRKLLSYAQRMPSIKSEVDLHQLIDDSSLILNSTIDRRIVINLSKKAKDSGILADESEIQNIILNLCINASHAIEGTGTILISTSNTTIDEAYCSASKYSINPGEYVALDVSDSGCGILPEHIEKIFDPFFTTKEQGQGTGLGLASVHGTVCNHDGEITVRSNSNGTTFTILLPVHKTPVNEVSPLCDKGAKCDGSKHILVIDDEQIICTTIKAILEPLGYQVATFTNGSEAIAYFAKYKSEIDVIILDIIMPELKGDQVFTSLTRKIHQM